jgi:hypothetical protein
VEVASSLSSRQLAFLANGPKYIPACQSRFSRLPINTIISREHQKLVECFKPGFTDNCVSSSDQRAIHFFASIEALLRQLHTKPLSPRTLARAQYDHRMATSIYRVLNKREIILRKTDKSKVFHLGSAASYRQKSFDYMLKTQAYQRIESGMNPAMNHLREVLALVDPLLEKKRGIDLDLWKQNMRPNPATIELAHLYFIPKPHKVTTTYIVGFSVYFGLAGDTVETDCFVDASSSHRCLTLS